ncbi:MAG: recombinase A [Myxococcales bacterium]|nr:recombinase A [Myxococcales bacterium]MCB9705778.1 recombinase A [Myxococcales bacterium]
MKNGSLEANSPLSAPISQTPRDLSGRLIELSGRGASARLSVAVNLLREAQLAAESSAWIQRRGGDLFPPDLAAAGVDLEALVVLHLPADEGPRDLLRAAEWLLRSGAYGLVVVDLAGLRPPRDLAWIARLVALARQHRSRLVLITDTPEHQASLGPLVGLRIAPRRRGPAHAGRFSLDLQVLKNKSGGPLPLPPGPWRAPAGLEV